MSATSIQDGATEVASPEGRRSTLLKRDSLVQVPTSFAILWYFRTIAREHGQLWKTLIAPPLGGGLMLFSGVAAVPQPRCLSGAAGAAFIRYGPWLVPIAFLLGIGAAVWFRARDTARYEVVGRFVHEEA